LVRELAKRAECNDGPSRFSYSRNLGPARLIMMDARTGRQLQAGQRRIMTDGEWQWIVLQLGHTRFAAAARRALDSTTHAGMPRLRWRSVTRPHFRNQVDTRRSQAARSVCASKKCQVAGASRGC